MTGEAIPYFMPTEANKLKLLNSALRMVGSFHIDANDESSTTYEIISRAYSQAITEVFGDNTFSYSVKRGSSTGVESTEFNSFKYEHTLPEDINLLLYTENSKDDIVADIRLSSGKVYANEQYLHFTYSSIPNIETSAAGVPAFLSRLLALHMAQNVTIELSGSENRHEILHVQYIKALKRARVLDGRQGPKQTFYSENNSRILEAQRSYGSV